MTSLLSPSALLQLARSDGEQGAPLSPEASEANVNYERVKISSILTSTSFQRRSSLESSLHYASDADQCAPFQMVGALWTTKE